MLQQLRAHLDA